MKVAIVGAGSIGLYLSWKLSEKGHNVFLFEKREKIGREVCSGLFSERILEFLPQIKDLILNEIDYCLIHFPKRTIKLNFKKRFFVVNHWQLDQKLLKIAKESGVKIILGKKIEKIPKEFEKIIGCDGANSTIRRLLGLKAPFFYLGIQGFINQKDYSNFVETWPTKDGFLWKIPRGEMVEWGIMEKLNKAQKILTNFLREKHLKLENIRSAIIPQGLIIPNNEKITLCGDAAGLTKPWSGGGVIWSLIAANFLLKNFPHFLKYKKEVEKFFLPRIIFSKLIRKMVYFLGFKLPYFFPTEFQIESDFLI